MEEIARVRLIGQPPMTEREWKIYTKRQMLIKAGDTKALAEFDAKLNKNNEKKVEQEIKEESEK